MIKLNLIQKSIIPLLFSGVAFAQVTTARLSGLMSDANGKALSNTSFVLKNTSIGLDKTYKTNDQGRFVISNLQVGGPYQLVVDNPNFETYRSQDIFLDLGNNNSINISLFTKEDKIKSIDGVNLIGKNKMNDNRSTGTSTNIGSNLLKALPTISRSTDDFLRLTPSSSETFNGISFAGRNGQYNNFSLDGAVFNNPFGLDAPSPGGQTGATPISLDAIEQIQVNIAPYDVTQAGFTGAGINSVTKSGKNKSFGTIFSFFRNQSLIGQKIDGQKISVPALNSFVFGASQGGAIVKDKLFYFFNFEVENREDGNSSYVAQNASNKNEPNTSRVLEADMIAVSTILKNRYGYDTGKYQGFTYRQENQKWIAKLDWNINQNHKFSITYNGLNAVKGKPAHPSAIGRRGPDFTTLQYQNTGYEMNNKLHSFSSELNSSFGNKASNKLRMVYTTFKDTRDPFSSPFPSLNITKNGVRYIVAGHEPFSINNKLNQKTFQITNNFNLNLDKHSLTFGASYENFSFENSFNLTGYGPALFDNFDINNFIATNGNPMVFGFIPFSSQVDYARQRSQFQDWTWYGLKVGQASLYAQDEFQVNERLKMVYGLRVDKPLYGDSYYRSPKMNPDGTFAGSYTEGSPTIANNDNLILYNAEGVRIQNGKGKDLDNSQMPTGKALISPRAGFTYDLKEDKSLVIRGGSGLFTGRFPFVWLGNQIGNPFSDFYNVTSKDFKWPQVWRSNLGLDYNLKSTGTVFTGDVAYTKDLNSMMVRNYRFGNPTGTLNSSTGDTRAFYTANDQGANDTYVFTNTNLGYQFNATFQAQQNFKKGWYAMLGYNYLISKDASSVSAEISSDAFQRNPVVGNVNQPVLSNSMYGNSHRFVYAASKKLNSKSKYATTISVFGSSNSGNRFAYVYGGDINGDGVSTNDLLYVPTANEINTMVFTPFTDALGQTYTASQQKESFEKFIQQDEYLSGKRGQYTGKYEAKSPWLTQLDLRILQDVIWKTSNKDYAFQLSMDVVNFGNLINSQWGVRRYATTSGYYQPISAQLTGNTPSYQFDPNLTTSFNPSPEVNSRWQIQFGVRFSF